MNPEPTTLVADRIERIESSAVIAALRAEITSLWAMLDSRNERIRELEARLKRESAS